MTRRGLRILLGGLIGGCLGGAVPQALVGSVRLAIVMVAGAVLACWLLTLVVWLDT